ncbi:MAG: UDP-3-O-acyl-N-acetylglucosamine deacetylase [Candidatus Omnitrophota bacterium]|nr:UDP-3-O-acyl-N-acetylglucosamine deacetylase [Candidatus Omnitrophota bacterium]MDZ4242422.1 UDP-3-O-acyl-N-acetylglucosamine deacetylase [Candidatus Omnitrophota bacterium]
MIPPAIAKAMTDPQKTIRSEFSLKGVGLHTGNAAEARFKPAPQDHGISFVRTDLPGRPVVKVGPDSILGEAPLPRCTTIGRQPALIHTVEHMMSVLCGLGIDNLIVEINNNELPGLDGSGLEYLKALKAVGVLEQKAARQYFDVKEPVGVCRDGASIFVVPDPEFKISYVLDYPNPFLRSQFFSTTVTGEIFEREIAPCRTFCLEEEAKRLQSSQLGLGANYQNTLVVGEKGVINNQVRFPDEFARHKVLDFIGDLYLLGKPIRGQVFAVKSGHTLNIALLKKLSSGQPSVPTEPAAPFVPQIPGDSVRALTIEQIMQILPHRYPFLLVDRVTEMEKGKRAVGIKNVTINDNFFEGHFPSRPIMPGVLMVEALAQLGGIVVLTDEKHRGQLALFMGADSVKFRKLVVPGDQLVLDVSVVRDRSRTAVIHGEARVNGEIVTEADILVSFTDNTFLN